MVHVRQLPARNLSAQHILWDLHTSEQIQEGKLHTLYGISNGAHVQFTPVSVVDCTLSFGFELQDLVLKGEVMLTV